MINFTHPQLMRPLDILLIYGLFFSFIARSFRSLVSDHDPFSLDVIDLLNTLCPLYMLARFYYFNSAAVVKEQVERLKIITKDRSPIYAQIIVDLRKHNPAPRDHFFSAERWTAEVIAKDKSGGKSLVVATNVLHSSKAAALADLEAWLSA